MREMKNQKIKSIKEGNASLKILVICQHYRPEPFRISDICEELSKRGHEVLVVCQTPNYPEGEIYPGYDKGKRQREVLDGVRVRRVKVIPRKTGVAHRILNYFSYPKSACRFVKSSECRASDGSDFDVVFSYQLTPVMMAEPAIEYSRIHGVPLLMYCLDLWPESLTSGGISRDSLVFRAFRKISGRIYRAADRILVSSRPFIDYLNYSFGLNLTNENYLPQHAENVFEGLDYEGNRNRIRLLFAGNVGLMQSVDTILDAAELLKNEPVHFDIVGVGSDLERVKKLAFEKNLKNVTFHGRFPLEKMPEFYSKADAMLVTAKADSILDYTLPGKVQSYMAAGRPVIAAATGATREIIEESGCGLCSDPEDGKAFAENITRFMNLEDKKKLAVNARKYYEENFTRERFMDRLESELQALHERSMNHEA